MYNVSLLPAEYRLKHQSEKKKDASLLIALSAMCALLIIYLVLTFITNSKTKELDRLIKQNKLTTAEITELTPLSSLYKETQSTFDIVKSAAGTNPEWDNFVAFIGNSIPETMGLISIDMSYSGSSGKCIIIGTAQDHKTVSDWIVCLEEASRTGEIRCSYSEVSSGSLWPVEFEISFSLLPGEGYKLPSGVEIYE
ncbi:MAG: hypothetical protein GX957_15065 [Clostridiaceae bacterium]|nr:hypothetical protein [Clostridiaceae bacterium]